MISEGILGNFHCKVQYFVFNLTFHVWHATMRFEFLRNLWNIALTEFELPFVALMHCIRQTRRSTRDMPPVLIISARLSIYLDGHCLRSSA